MQIASDRMQGLAGRQAGLAAWLLNWIGAPLRERLAGMGKVRAERRMKLVEVLQLGGKRQLLMVVCEGRRYLVGAGGDSVQSIAEIGTEISMGSTRERAMECGL